MFSVLRRPTSTRQLRKRLEPYHGAQMPRQRTVSKAKIPAQLRRIVRLEEKTPH